MSLDLLSKEGLLYVSFLIGGLGLETFKEGDKLFGTGLLALSAVLLILRGVFKLSVVAKERKELEAKIFKKANK